MNFNTDIIPRHSIEALCLAWNNVRDTARKAIADMKAANDRLADIFGSEHDSFGRNAIYLKLPTPEDIEVELLECKRRVWSEIVSRTGIRHLMSVKQQADLDQQLWDGSRYKHGDKDNLPDLAPDLIYGWIEELGRQLPDMLTAAIEEVFDLLTPQRRDGYKTNEKNREMVGKKIILHWFIDAWIGRPSLRYEREKYLTAIGNVFSLLDGKGIQKPPHDLVTQLKEHLRTASNGMPYEDEYFRIKVYKGTQTLHMELKRQDLVQELNVRVAKMALGKGKTA